MLLSPSFTRLLMSKVITKFKEYLMLARLTWSEAQLCSESGPKALLRMIWLLATKGFSTRELRAYGQHLMHYRSQMPIVISKQRSLDKLAKWNPRRAADLTEDKHHFYVHCEEQNLPTPKHCFTTIGEDGRFTDWLGSSETSAAAALPLEFIIKDRSGAYGSGFRAFRRSGTSLYSDSKTLSVADFQNYLADGNQQFVLQERLYDHSSLTELSGVRSLQCLRLNTVRSQNGTPRPFMFIITLLGGKSPMSNFSFGTSGNLIAFGDLATGTLSGAVVGRQARIGLDVIDQHPVTGSSLRGMQLPFWDDCLKLVVQAHETLENLDVIGWDIAITETGPMLIEGNAWFDPPSYAPWVIEDRDWDMIFS